MCESVEREKEREGGKEGRERVREKVKEKEGNPISLRLYAFVQQPQQLDWPRAK
jgi:hypothetical protein